MSRSPSDPNALNRALDQLRRQFLEQLPLRVTAIDTEASCLLRGAWNPDAAQRLRLLAHSLAGAAGTFGAHGLSQVARRLEQSLTPFLESPPLEKDARVALHRNVLEVIYMARDTQTARRPPEFLPWQRARETDPRQVYVVEDDVALGDAMAVFLRRAGYHVQAFCDVEQFLRDTADAPAPQALIMDLMFPQGNDAGARALAAFRQRHGDAVPAILISARDDMQARLEALRAGANRYLVKPLNLERLLRLLDDLTDRHVHDPYCVLLVDDELAVLSDHGTILREAGMRVLEVSNPLQAFGVAEEFDPDVIVLDMEMPEISGTELAALLRENDDFSQIPLLFLSSERDMRQQLLAIDLGGDDVLQKPIQPAHLVAVVRSYAKRSRQARIVSHNLHRAISEKEYQQFALNQHAIVSVANAHGTITQVNDRFCQISGYSADELIGRNHRIVKSDFHTPDFFAAMWETISAGQVWQGVICNRRKDGTRYWVESTIVPFLDEHGLPYQYVSIRTDVTEIKQAETALRTERSLTIAAIDAMPGVFYLISADYRFLRYNRSLREISGYSDQELASLSPLDLFAPEDRPRIETRMREVFAHGHAAAETDLVTKDGLRIPYYFQGAHVEIDGQSCIIGTGLDISQIKDYQAALLAAKDQAEQASRAKSQFLASMSHELRTPMNAILGFAQLSESDPDLTLDQRDNVEEILKAGRHLLDLINEILDLAKIESGQITVSLESVACDPLLTEIRHLIQPLADQRGIALEQAPTGALTAYADRTRLKQALINLLANAVKYNRPGGHVRVEAHPVGTDWVRLSVIDNGPGIPPSRLPELFQPFHRLHDDAQAEGTGIGLALSRRVVEAMGGRIDVASEEGRGSTFWIELPSAPPQAHVAPSAAHAVEPVAGSAAQTVLYIEDNPANAKLVESLLGRLTGLKLLVAHDASTGLDLAQTHRPRLILLDINLPGMDGYAALERLRQHDATRRIPVVAVSANAQHEDVARGRRAGFAAYLTKPIDVPVFLTTVDRLLQPETNDL